MSAIDIYKKLAKEYFESKIDGDKCTDCVEGKLISGKPCTRCKQGFLLKHQMTHESLEYFRKKIEDGPCLSCGETPTRFEQVIMVTFQLVVAGMFTAFLFGLIVFNDPLWSFKLMSGAFGVKMEVIEGKGLIMSIEKNEPDSETVAKQKRFIKFLEDNGIYSAFYTTREMSLMQGVWEKATQPIEIPMSVEECDKVSHGEEYNWNFNGIEVRVFNESELDEEERLEDL